MVVPDFFDANKNSWNQRTSIHTASDFYDVKGFLAGKNPLREIELALMGEVNDLTLLHLQCHFGMDTLAWGRMGAHCTGIDFSETAIAKARELNITLNMDAEFVCCNVYETRQHITRLFDRVFTSYGTIGWLPELQPWAKVIADSLKPGGRFIMADFHPVVWMFDEDFKTIAYAYDNKEVIITDSTGTYANRDAPIACREYGWNHSISEILNALIGAGLQLDTFNEYDYSPYACFNQTIEGEPGRWYIKGLEKKIPMVYGIVATKD